MSLDLKPMLDELPDEPLDSVMLREARRKDNFPPYADLPHKLECPRCSACMSEHRHEYVEGYWRYKCPRCGHGEVGRIRTQTKAWVLRKAHMERSLVAGDARGGGGA